MVQPMSNPFEPPNRRRVWTEAEKQEARESARLRREEEQRGLEAWEAKVEARAEAKARFLLKGNLQRLRDTTLAVTADPALPSSLSRGPWRVFVTDHSEMKHSWDRSTRQYFFALWWYSEKKDCWGWFIPAGSRRAENRQRVLERLKLSDQWRCLASSDELQALLPDLAVSLAALLESPSPPEPPSPPSPVDFYRGAPRLGWRKERELWAGQQGTEGLGRLNASLLRRIIMMGEDPLCPRCSVVMQKRLRAHEAEAASDTAVDFDQLFDSTAE